MYIFPIDLNDNATLIRVSGITGMIFRQHKNDLVISYPFFFEVFVNNQGIDRVTVVEEEFRAGQDDV